MIHATLGGQPVRIHETRSLDVGQFLQWSRRPDNRILGLDTEGLPFNHEDRMNHFGPLSSRWMRLCQFGSLTEAWNLDPLGVPSHMEAVRLVFEDRNHWFPTWGPFDAEAVYQALGIDIVDRYLNGMMLANLIAPGPLVAHDLKQVSWTAGDTELRDAQEEQDAHWLSLQVPAPRKPVRPRAPRKGETRAQFEERLFQFRTVTMAAWQREVQAYYERYPRREDDRATPSDGYKMGWTGWRDIPRDDHLFQKYAGLDAIAARRRWPELVEQAKTRGVYRPVAREVDLDQSMARVKIRGTRADRQYAQGRLSVVRPEHLAAKASFLDLTGVKATSPKRVDWLRSQGMKFNPKAVTKGTTNPSLTAQHVKDYLAAYASDRGDLTDDGYRALELIKVASETQNLTTFLGGLVSMMDPNDRIHPAFNTLGAKTGRWTAREPAVQTFSKKSGTRGIVIPEPGHVLVSIDQAQIEVRVFAVLCGDPALLDAFNRGEDCYGTIATKVFGPSFTKDQRSMCKRILLGGCLYAGGPATLQTQLHDIDGLVISQEKIIEVRSDLYARYPLFRKTLRRMNGPEDVWLPSGRYVPGDEDRGYRQVNSFCQGTARDILVDTIMRAVVKGYERNIRLVLHDEVLFSLAKDDLDRQLIELTECFRVPFEYQGNVVNIDCDVEIYPERWGGQMIEWHGPSDYQAGPKGARVTGVTLDGVLTACAA